MSWGYNRVSSELEINKDRFWEWSFSVRFQTDEIVTNTWDGIFGELQTHFSHSCEWPHSGYCNCEVIGFQGYSRAE